MTTNPTPYSPPPVADRRRRERRSSTDPHAERAQLLRQAAATGIAVCGGLTCLFLFFVAIGTVNLGNAAVASLVVLLLACIWISGIIYARRHENFRGNRADRERRGF